MKITLTKMDLLAGLTKLNKVISNKTLPILANVKIVAKNNTVQLIGSNVDLNGIVTIEHENIVNEGVTLLNYKDIHTFIKKTKSDLITIENNDNKVSVNAGKVNFKVETMDSEDYPLLPELKYEEVTLKNEEFKKTIENTGYAISTSETRPVLTAINIKVNENGLNFVATDSHRLGTYKMNTDTVITELECNPMGTGLILASKLLDKKNNSDVKMKFNEQYTVLEFDNMELYVKNVEGNYPNTDRLIPLDFNTELELNTDELLELLPQLALFNKECNSAINLNYTDSVMISSDSEKGKIESNVKTYETIGDQLNVSFNYNYLHDVLKVLKSDKVKIKFNGKLKPFIIEGMGQGEKHLILPVRKY